MSCVRAHGRAFLSLSLCVLAITSCRTATEPTAGETPPTDTIVSSTPPFKTKEPDHYSATRTITTLNPKGEKFVERRLIGRDGLIRREEFASEQTRIVYLDSPEGRFIVWPEQKVYAVFTGGSSGPPELEPEENSPDRLLHTEPINTAYQLLGTETVDGRSAAKYRVNVNALAPGNVTNSEMLIWVDSVLNLPLKSEVRSSDGVVIVTELSDITLQPDKQLFQIPTGYEKIEYSALQKQLKARGWNP